jgi:hypothetical protein
MTITLEKLIRHRLDNSDFPEALPTKKQLATVSKEDYQANLPPLTQEIQAALKEAKIAFRESAVGQKLAKDAPGMHPAEVMALGKEVLKIPEIARVMDLATQTDVFDTSASLGGTIIKQLIAQYAPRSLVLNFSVIAEIFVGVSGYIGFAFSLTDRNNYSIYIGGTVGVGEDALFALGEGIGLSSNTYSSMTGACVGADIGASEVFGLLVDFSLGVKAPYWPVAENVTPSQWTFFAYFLEGFGGGIDFYAGFTLTILNDTLPDMVQPPAANSTTVNLIQCLEIQDSSGCDEIYFTVHLDDEPAKVFRYPLWDYFSINKGGVWDIGFTINFNSKFSLSLYNSNTGGDDLITTFNLNSSQIPAPGQTRTLTYDTQSGGLFHNYVKYNVKLYTPNPV